jgi:hypothetical protein
MAYHVVRSGYNQLAECVNHYRHGATLLKREKLISFCRCCCYKKMTPVSKKGPTHPRKILSSEQIQSRYLNRFIKVSKN